MQYRKLKGTALFDGKDLLPDHTLVLNEEGTIQDLLPHSDVAETEEWPGIICPGFVNAHCHLELSHMKGKLPEGTGLVDFLITVVESRNNQAADKQKAFKAASIEMYANGISGVADICNTADTVDLKKHSPLQWYNLVEVINLNDAHLQAALENCNRVKNEFERNGFQAVLTPHAPYSVSADTYAAINKATKGAVISMHNQETQDENALFENGDGDFLRLYAKFGSGISPFATSGTTSLQTWLPYFTEGQTIILVHNTATSEEDIVFAKNHAARYGLTLVYCLCPNANRYIEKKLPPVDLLVKHDCLIVIGTDSYSSNHQLSIAAELKTLKLNFPHLTTKQLLNWATANGADAIRWQHLGRFNKGTRPGVILLNETDFSVRRLM